MSPTPPQEPPDRRESPGGERPPPAGGGSRSLASRWVLGALGWICLALGFVGVILPVVPTTPLVLLAAACFARSSPRFERWLLGSRLFGPILRDWREHRAIPRSAKRTAIVLAGAAFGLSVYALRARPVAAALLGALGLGCLIFLARLPVRDPPERDIPPSV